MSTDATRSTYLLFDIPSHEKHFLLAVADRATDDGICWPSIQRMMADTNMSRRTIIRTRNSLIKKGYIEYTGRMAGRSGQIPVMRLTYVDHREGNLDPVKKIDYLSDPNCPEEDQNPDLTSAKVAPVSKWHQCQNVTEGVKSGTGTSATLAPITKRGTNTTEREGETHTLTDNFENLKIEICADAELKKTFQEKNLTNKYPTIGDFFDFYKEYQLTKNGGVTRYGFKNWLDRERAIPLTGQSPTFSQDKTYKPGPIYARTITPQHEYSLFRSAFENDKKFKINGRNENSIAPSYDEWLNLQTGSV